MGNAAGGNWTAATAKMAPTTTGAGMRKVKVRHRPLPGIGDLFELETASGPKITVVNQRSGRREISIGETATREPVAIVTLTRTAAAAVAQLLSGAHVEIIRSKN
jgi:K+/H+ antiporter YhaU regulatory subunit KhtT